MPDAKVSLGLDSRELAAELRGAVQRFEGGLDRMQKSSKRASAGISGAMSKIGGALAALGISREILRVISYGSTIQDMSERFGVAASTLQKFGNEAEKAGSSLDAVGKGFRFLAVNREKALSGNDAMVSAFRELGISIEDLRSLNPEQIMLKIGSSSLNAADLVKVLGKSALELRPLLSGLADGSIEFGKALSDLDIQRLDEADDAIKELKQSITILIGSNLPAFFTLAEASAAGVRATVKALNIELTALANIFSKFSPDFKNFDPRVALEKFKEIRRIGEKGRKDADAAYEAEIDTASDKMLAKMQKREETRAKNLKFGKSAAAFEDSEAGATDDEGRSLGGRGKTSNAQRRTSNAEVEQPPPNPFEGLTLREALQKQSQLQNEAGPAAPLPGGPVAGVGESQEKINEIEANRRAQNDYLAQPEVQQAFGDRAGPKKPYDMRAAEIDRETQLKQGHGELQEKSGNELIQAATELKLAADAIKGIGTNQ